MKIVDQTHDVEAEKPVKYLKIIAYTLINHRAIFSNFLFFLPAVIPKYYSSHESSQANSISNSYLFLYFSLLFMIFSLSFSPHYFCQTEFLQQSLITPFLPNSSIQSFA